MTGTYSHEWSSPYPGCLIILVDQSGSMADTFGRVGSGQRKCDVVATIINSFLREFILANTTGGDTVRPRADIAIIGYEGSSAKSALGGSLDAKDFVTLPELDENPIEVESRKRQEVDGVGQIVETIVPFVIWVKPKAGLGTPMCAALRKAKELAERWVHSHPDNYPPVVINITDGEATDGDPLPPARELCQVSTSDGQTLLFNLHLTELNKNPIEYPASEREIPNDPYAKQLFAMSSTIPKSSRAMLDQLRKQARPPQPPLAPDARGFIFHGDATSIRYMFELGTKPAIATQAANVTSPTQPTPRKPINKDR